MKKLIVLLAVMSVFAYSDTYKKENKTIKNSAGTVKIDGKTYDSKLAQDRRVRFVILHYTAVDKEQSITILTKAAGKCSLSGN